MMAAVGATERPPLCAPSGLAPHSEFLGSRDFLPRSDRLLMVPHAVAILVCIDRISVDFNLKLGTETGFTTLGKGQRPWNVEAKDNLKCLNEG
jgi:hypothetical protein